MENDATKSTTFFRFEDLRVYNKALDYIDWVYNTTGLMPRDTAGNIIDRFINAAQAIALNIAEGSARNKSQFIYYLKLAKSSVRECVVTTAIAEKQNLITDTLIDESRTELMEMTKMIGALIGSLQKSNGKGKNNGRYYSSEEKDDYHDEFMPANSIDVKKY